MKLLFLVRLANNSIFFIHLIWGTRQALIFGLSTALSTAFVGLLTGTISAFSGGWIDNLTMRITDAFLSFPTIAAVALFSQIQSFLSPEIYGSYMNISDIVVELSFLQKLIMQLNPTFIALVFFSWMPYARIIHTQILQVKQMQYIEAARAVGVKPLRMIFHHLLPNALTPAIVYTLGILAAW